MKTLVITPKDQSEFKFLTDLFKKLHISAAAVPTAKPTKKSAKTVNETEEDAAIVRMIESGLKSGHADTKQVLKKLGI